ncbi:MAG TPA: glycosyltransferase [Thermoanaerobaculia bacterium]|nr:glycosyltransferase [Thermoanaerobaculia bacterium]
MSRPGPLRVARIIARLNVGGPAQHVVWLTEALQDEEFESVLITGIVPPGEDDMSAFAAAHGVRPVVIPEMSREISPRDVVTIWKLFRFFRRYRPDVVHTHTAKAGAAGRAAGFLYRVLTPRARVTFVHTFHGHVFHSYYGALKTRVFLLIEKVLARLATDAIVVLSEQQRREIHERFGIGKREQFRIVPLGLDLDGVQGAPEARTTPTVAIIGRLTAVKNHELFLRVAARFEDARFVVYGDGADRAALEARGTHVEFAGTRPAREIYGAIDIAALTSLNEGTPLTLIEAIANGIPVISTAVGGVVDLLGAVEETHDGFDIRERGITAASNDEIGFAAGLRRLLDDAALRQRFGERGRVFARANYSKERLIGDIRRLYRELTASS